MIRSIVLLALLVAAAVAYPTNDINKDILDALEHPWETATKDLRNPTIVTRAQWGARASGSVSTLATPVPNVIIHHTVTGSCTTRDACNTIMRSMQNHHMNTNGWSDIGYNFAVGGNGEVYEGRGWRTVGAHATNWNSNSMGIALIGTFTTGRPTAAQINAARSLIAMGISNNFIQSNHRLMGHRQAGSTECPGNALYSEIQTWPNWR